MLQSLVLVSLLIASICNAQDVPSSSPTNEIESLKKRVQDLEEIQKESSEIIKRQLADQHFDQNSRGYIEIKGGMSFFNPKEIDEENDDTFNSADSANWKHFERATILEFEIGKTVLAQNDIKHEFGIGYQHLRSKIDASFTDSGDKYNVFETVSIHSLFIRYAMLFQADKGKWFIGPGMTLGYSPVSELKIEIERGNEGAQIKADNQSPLFEIFAKSKYEISRYFSFVGIAGYRLQEAENLRLNAAELLSVKTRVDLDASGFYGLIGLAVSF